MQTKNGAEILIGSAVLTAMDNIEREVVAVHNGLFQLYPGFECHNGDIKTVFLVTEIEKVIEKVEQVAPPEPEDKETVATQEILEVAMEDIVGHVDKMFQKFVAEKQAEVLEAKQTKGMEALMGALAKVDTSKEKDAEFHAIGDIVMVSTGSAQFKLKVIEVVGRQHSSTGNVFAYRGRELIGNTTWRFTANDIVIEKVPLYTIGDMVVKEAKDAVYKIVNVEVDSNGVYYYVENLTFDYVVTVPIEESTLSYAPERTPIWVVGDLVHCDGWDEVFEVMEIRPEPGKEPLYYIECDNEHGCLTLRAYEYDISGVSKYGVSDEVGIVGEKSVYRIVGIEPVNSSFVYSLENVSVLSDLILSVEEDSICDLGPFQIGDNVNLTETNCDVVITDKEYRDGADGIQCYYFGKAKDGKWNYKFVADEATPIICHMCEIGEYVILKNGISPLYRVISAEWVDGSSVYNLKEIGAVESVIEVYDGSIYAKVMEPTYWLGEEITLQNGKAVIVVNDEYVVLFFIRELTYIGSPVATEIRFIDDDIMDVCHPLEDGAVTDCCGNYCCGCEDPEEGVDLIDNKFTVGDKLIVCINDEADDKEYEVEIAAVSSIGNKALYYAHSIYNANIVFSFTEDGYMEMFDFDELSAEEELKKMPDTNTYPELTTNDAVDSSWENYFDQISIQMGDEAKLRAELQNKVAELEGIIKDRCRVDPRKIIMFK